MVASSHVVSKFNLLKGYWQIQLTERAKLSSTSITTDAFYQNMALLKNAPVPPLKKW